MCNKLIITICRHSRFGYILRPVFASYRFETEIYTITETALSLSPAFMTLTADEQEMIILAERYTDKRLMETYSKETNEAVFLQKVSNRDIANYIRPFIEKKEHRIIELIRKTGIPVFLREKIAVRDFTAGQALKVMKEPSEMVFCFRYAEKFRYNIEIKNRTLNSEINAETPGSGIQNETSGDGVEGEVSNPETGTNSGTSSIGLYGRFFAPLVSNPAVAVIGQELHYFSDVDEKKLRPFFEKPFIEVPERTVPDYIRKFVVQCVKRYEVRCEGITVFEQEHNPVAVLTFEHDLNLQPVLTLHFQYGKHRIPLDKPYQKVVEVLEENGAYSIGWFYRHEQWERERIAMLLEGGLSQTRTGQFFVHQENEQPGSFSPGVIEWINQHGSLLQHFELRQPPGKILYYTGEIDLQVGVSDSIDWFDLKCIVRFDEVEIPFSKFKRHIINNIREFILPDGRVAILPAVWFSRFGEMFRYGKNTGDSIRLSHYHFRVKQLAQEGFIPEEKPSAVDIPPFLQATLRPYQVAGFHWLVWLQQRHFGGCLADDMGLGKTLQTITLLLYSHFEPSDNTKSADSAPLQSSPTMKSAKGAPRQLSLFDDSAADFDAPSTDIDRGNEVTFRKKECPPTLIVMPTSLVHNWLNEFRKFAPMFDVYVHTGSNRLQKEGFAQAMTSSRIILTSYGIVRQDIDFLSRHHFHYLILDESQTIKNHSSKIFECVKQLHSTYKLALTGTPVENSLSDLWSQMDFLNDGILGKYGEFRNRYREAEVIDNEAERQLLHKIIEPFLLRRTKEEVTPELPALMEESIYCEMEERQAMLYNEEKNKSRNALLEQSEKGNRLYMATALKSLTRLRQIACHPAMLADDYPGTSAKFEQIIAQAEILFAGQHKVLLFSSYVKHLKLLAGAFDERGWRYAWLTGSTTDREGAIRQFNTDETVRAFFISLKAGSTGLNLTAADYVFIIDPWWNPAAEMQAVSRAHRIGQDKKVTLYRFITKGTVEEKIERLQLYKKALTDALIVPQLSRKEIDDLLNY